MGFEFTPEEMARYEESHRHMLRDREGRRRARLNVESALALQQGDDAIQALKNHLIAIRDLGGIAGSASSLFLQFLELLLIHESSPVSSGPEAGTSDAPTLTVPETSDTAPGAGDAAGSAPSPDPAAPSKACGCGRRLVENTTGEPEWILTEDEWAKHNRGTGRAA